MNDTFHGMFFLDGEFRERYVQVENGRIKKVSIEKIGNDVKRLEGQIIPGGVDIHVHFREPGETHKEDFKSGSRSAIFGGTTTVMDMPNNLPPIADENSFADKLNAIRNKSYVDFGLYQMASGSIVDDAIGEKVFLGKSTGGLLTDLERVNFSGKIVAAHAELQNCLDMNTGKDDSLRNHDSNRPLECELGAIEFLSGTRIKNGHLAHLTSKQTLNFGKRLGFTTEVTPHHLLLNNEIGIGAYGKMNPPLRKKKIQEDLLNSVNSVPIDVIASDHAPHTISEKENFENAPSGVPGAETRVPLVLMLFKRNILTLEKVIRLVSSEPSRRIGIPKGYIAEGYDADFAVYDLKEEIEIRGENLHSKCGWTPFEGFRGVFPISVYLRGENIIEEGEMVSEPKGVFISGKGKGKADYQTKNG